jgi:hypothetical protein
LKGGVGIKHNGRLKFAVASELCKRGYEVSFTMGNTTPLADLMVVSPKFKKMFLIDVKGLYRQNPWLLKRKPSRENLFYVFAYVPTDEPNQYFLMSQGQVNRMIHDELTRLKRPEDCSMPGIVWKLTLPHKDAWQVLPK